MTKLTLYPATIAFLWLTACGGGGDGATPSAPVAVTAFGGSRHMGEIGTPILIAWQPPADDGGSPIVGYELALFGTPDTSLVVRQMKGTRALVSVQFGDPRGYNAQLSARARNRAGLGAASPLVALSYTVAAFSNQVDISVPTSAKVNGDDSPNGQTDPAVSSSGWMAYSGVSFTRDADDRVVRDLDVRLARPAGVTRQWQYVATIAAAAPATVTDADPALSLCGSAMCEGRWIYRSPWLLEDASDPNPARRFKLYAHKHFQRPGADLSTTTERGLIVLWTASDLNGPWSAETPALAWQSSPPELPAGSAPNANALHADLAACRQVADGSARVRGAVIDFAFSCIYGTGTPLPRKIVLLRSSDHGVTLRYIATLLGPEDDPGAPVGSGPAYYDSPAFSGLDSEPVLFVSPLRGNAECDALAFSDDDAGQLFRDSDGKLVPVRKTRPAYVELAPSNGIGNSCARGSGILQGARIDNADPTLTRFYIHAVAIIG